MNWYQLTADEALSTLKSSSKVGLTQYEVAQRLEKYGENALPEVHPESWLKVFLRQFQNPLIYILLAAAALIFFLGEHRLDAFIISGVLFFNALIGMIQEGRTKNILHSLKQFTKTDCVVVRDGKTHVISDRLLVPGDIIIVQEGTKVPADARIIENQDVRADESSLTGESKPVIKQENVLTSECAVAEQKNMLFRGTYITNGLGRAVVVETGVKTHIGKIHTVSEDIDTDIPLKNELEHLSYIILLFILAMCVFLFAVGFLTGKPAQELLVMLTALFICVVPEGLPVVLTLVLASGAYSMAKQKVLIKRMDAVDGLGRVDTIIIDKTGTLTRSEMMVCAAYVDSTQCTVSGNGYFSQGHVTCGRNIISDPSLDTNWGKMALAVSLLNTTELIFIEKQNLFEVKGDPTEAALGVFGKKLGYDRDQLLTEWKKVFEIPFHPHLRFHVGFFQKDGEGIAVLTGSPEALFEHSDSKSQEFHTVLSSFLHEGLRVVACGYKKVNVEGFTQGTDTFEQNRNHALELIKSDVEFVGFCGIQDSIRPGIEDIIAQARAADIRVIMATGDHKETALYVAKKVGIYQEGRDTVIEGSQLANYTPEQLAHALKTVTVFARLSPEMKLRVVEAYKKAGDIVAMTGDGINDVPSLLAAHVGIAMGNIGTEVAKQAADVVLLDDSFANLIKGVSLGRHTLYTLRRVILYFFATNMGEILIVLFALLLGFPLPITAAQILWLNLITDGFLDVALSMEPEEPAILTNKRFGRHARLIDGTMMYRVLYMAFPMGAGSLFVFWLYSGISLEYARTMTLITMAFFQWFNAWNCRSEYMPITKLGIFSNRWLWLATGVVLGLQIALLHLSVLQFIFKTVPITWTDWAFVIAITAPLFVIEESRKLVACYRSKACVD